MKYNQTMTKLITTLSILIFTLSVCAQDYYDDFEPINLKEYLFNPSKVKVKLNPKYTTFQLEEVMVEKLDSITLPVSGSNHKIKLISANNNIEKDIENIITSNYPLNNSLPIKIHITDIRILNNLLLTENPRIYLSMDFYIKDASNKYTLKHTTSNYAALSQPIEKPLGKLIKRTIEDFCRNKRYQNEILTNSTNSSDQTSGVYTTIHNLINNEINDSISYTIIPDEESKDNPIYYLVYNNDKEKTAMTTIAYTCRDKTYLNVGYYYPRIYFTELFTLNSEYYIIFDKIYDPNRATNNTIAFGGGVIGGLAASATAQTYSPALIDKKSGRMIALTRTLINQLLEDNKEAIDLYETTLKEGDIKSTIAFLNENLLNDQFTKKLNNL